MAGGKLSARQKMINLMYLVFIAMLALNMSKEVLSAFGVLNDKLATANVASDARNQAFIDGLAEKVSEQPEKYAPIMTRAQEVSALSTELDTYIAGIKGELEATVEDVSDYEVQDKTDFLDQRWFNGGEINEAGTEFVEKINNFRTKLVALTGDPESDIAKDIMTKFNTDAVANRDGVEINWLNYNYEGFPMIASRTKLTQIQADIKTTQSELLSNMLAGEQVKQLSMTNYQAIVVPDKTAFYSGENFKGKIVLGKYDPTLKFEKVIVNGREVTSTEAGQVVLNFPAGNVGTKDIKGQLQFKQGDSIVPIDFTSKYAVINRPNSATISADKMNVVYRGVSNPMTISFAGVSDNNVSASGSGLSKKSGSAYTMNPGTGREVSINVSANLPNGGGTVTDSKKFRIKDIPRPTGTIRGEDGDGGCVKMQRQGLERSSIGAELLDFDFDLKLNVSGFSMKVSGQPTVRVNGTKLNSQAIGALKRAKRGETVQIFDIQAKISGNSGYRLRKISSICIELTN